LVVQAAKEKTMVHIHMAVVAAVQGQQVKDS
jgi:hypothetical protein